MPDMDGTRVPGPTGVPPHASDLVGRTLPSGVRVLASLGETGEGSLYSAQSPTGLEVALLISRPEFGRTSASHPDLTDPTRQRIRQERIHQVMQIRHPNVLELYETGETSDGSFYIVHELPAGELLSTILAARGACPMKEAVELCLQAAAGLQAAHALGIVHGNVSAQTIVVAHTADWRPRLKLIGFSLGSISSADERSDVFGLGALLHHLLAGAPPESGSVAASIPLGVRAVLTKALARVPAQRFQSVSEFAGELERAAGVASPAKLEPVVGVGASTSAFRALWRGTVRVARWILWIARAAVLKGLVPPIRWIATSVNRRRLLEMAGAAVILIGIWLFWNSYRETISAEAQAGFQEARRLFWDDRDSALHASSRAPDPAKATRGTGTAPAQPLISPYRRAHPWAAPPGGRFYFRSSCPEALRFPDLLFFMSEQEARAAGFVPTTIPGCH